ncbi:MAG TPA: phosphatase PAP2 family protein [Chitinophagaceae bacterium]
MRKTVLIFLVLPGYVACAQLTTDTVSFDTSYTLKEKKSPAILRAGLALGYIGATYYCYRKEDNHFQNESQEHKHPLKDAVARNLSPLGTAQTNWMALGATTGFAYLTRNTRLQHVVFVWAGSLLINDALTNKLKNSFQRYRPSTGKPFNSFDGNEGPGANRSFPSAHTSNAFTTATVFATLYKDKHWVPPLAYGLATMVGFSRVYDNAHWASDVMAGAAVGFLSAKTMILTDKWVGKKNIRLYPQVSKRSASMGMVKTF